MVARIIPAAEAMEQALETLRAQGVVAVPTETVYGLAGDATSGEAVARIFEAKGRPAFNPLIAHVSSLEMAETLAVLDPLARTLAEAFWPGPLTLVLPSRPDTPVHPLVTAGLETVALRMPRGFAALLAGAFGRPLAAPSANRSGRITATTAGAVADELGARIELVVDGGPTPVGVESTILKVDGGRIHLLRPGGLAVEEIEELVGMEVLRVRAAGPVQAPGMLASHYAPDAALRLAATEVRAGEGLLAFGPWRAAHVGHAVAFRNLSETGDLREAAANLFSFLKALDASGAKTIAVEPIPGSGLGEAINDRLARAAAPR